MAFKLVPRERAAVRRWYFKDGGESETGEPRESIHYFGNTSENQECQAYDAELTNRSIPVHCHPVDQFQIFLGADGSKCGARSVPPLMLQYMDAYAPYGPLVGADPALHFLQLRAEPTEASIKVPRDRAEMPYRGRRKIYVDIPELKDTVVPQAGQTQTERLISSEEDGLGAFMINAGPNAVVLVPSAAGTSGQFTYIADGEAIYERETYGREAVGWQSSDDGLRELRAGPSGCRIIVMRMPFPATPVARAAESIGEKSLV